MAMALARGWAVAVTDYQGLGTPGDHAYMVGRALGPNVLDAMRAARDSPVELPDDGPAGILGYSEGGAAAAWAAQLQPTYAPDMPLFAVAAGAAAGDLEVAGRTSTAASSRSSSPTAGSATPPPTRSSSSTVPDRAGRKMIPCCGSRRCSRRSRGPKFAHATDMTEPNVLELPDWRAPPAREQDRRRSARGAGAALPRQARPDRPFRPERELRDNWKALGADVRLYVTRGGVDHISGGVTGTPVAIDWLARRLAGGRSRRAGGHAAAAADAPPPSLRLGVPRPTLPWPRARTSSRHGPVAPTRAIVPNSCPIPRAGHMSSGGSDPARISSTMARGARTAGRARDHAGVSSRIGSGPRDPRARRARARSRFRQAPLRALPAVSVAAPNAPASSARNASTAALRRVDAAGVEVRRRTEVEDRQPATASTSTSSGSGSAWTNPASPARSRTEQPYRGLRRCPTRRPQWRRRRPIRETSTSVFASARERRAARQEQVAAKGSVEAPLRGGFVLEVELVRIAFAELAHHRRGVDRGKGGAERSHQASSSARSWRTAGRAGAQHLHRDRSPPSSPRWT